MKDNQELVLLSAAIIMAFAIFIINRIRFKKKKKKRHDANNQDIIRKSVINTLADMESGGVYFIKDGNELPQKWRYDRGNGYTEKFKQKMKSKK